MKKALLAAGISLLLTVPAFANEPVTLSDRIDRLDEVIYGSVQEGSLLDRVDHADNLIYGNGYTSANGLDNRINNLYSDVVKSDDSTSLSIATRANAMEYYLTDEIKTDPLQTRIGNLETAVYGTAKKGALDQRMANLEKSVYGDQHYEMKEVELPKDTVFKISLNEDISSKTNQIGDPVTFTVEEDVSVGDVLVLPKGSQGSGVVTKVSRPKSFGRSGALDVSFDQVFSVDDQVIPTVLGPEAKEKLKMEAAAVGASAVGALALGPIGLVGGFFVKGKEVSLPAGSTLYIETQETVVTKGLQLMSGAPAGTVRKHIARNTSSATKEAAADNEMTEADITDASVTSDAAAKAEEVKKNTGESVSAKADEVSAKAEETAAKAEKASDEMSDKAKAELESVREKDTTGSSSEEAPSVVIVRNN